MEPALVRPPYFSAEHDSWIIPLTQGVIALVDDDIARSLGCHNWFAMASHKNRRWMAARGIRRPGRGPLTVYMHRKILTPNDGGDVDHEYHHDFDLRVIDNRRSNLRLCTGWENSCNRRKNTNGSVPYKGVFQNDRGKWSATIRVKGRAMYLGCFRDPIDAAFAYDKAAVEFFGEFASTNAKCGLL